MKWFELKVGQMYYSPGCFTITSPFIINNMSGNVATIRYLDNMTTYKVYFVDTMEFQQVPTEEANLIKMKKL